MARAGQRGAVTIATNMAGRGTDIKLGEGVRELGGLYVIGTERHESRRIDRQLRGRCSRQGDPGLTKFFLSLEDDLMRLFLQGNLASRLMEGSMQEGEELEHPLAQPLDRERAEEGRAAELLDPQAPPAVRRRAEPAARGRLWDPQRGDPRRAARRTSSSSRSRRRSSTASRSPVSARRAARTRRRSRAWSAGPTPISRSACSVEELAGGDRRARWRRCSMQRIQAGLRGQGVGRSPGGAGLARALRRHQRDRPSLAGAPDRDGGAAASIGLRSYGQKDPLVEYKSEAYRFFEELMNNVRLQICTGLFRSASNLESFENMLTLLSRTARAVGPADLPAPAPGRLPRAAVPPAPRCPRAAEWRRRSRRSPSRRSSCPRSPSVAKCRRWAGTTRVRAAAARSSSSAMGGEGVDFRSANFDFRFPAAVSSAGEGLLVGACLQAIPICEKPRSINYPIACKQAPTGRPAPRSIAGTQVSAIRPPVRSIACKQAPTKRPIRSSPGLGARDRVIAHWPWQGSSSCRSLLAGDPGAMVVRRSTNRADVGGAYTDGLRSHERTRGTPPGTRLDPRLQLLSHHLLR